MEITEDLKRRIWAKSIAVDGYDDTMVRKDACGAWIVYSDFGKRESPFGWEVDHIIPASFLYAKGISQEMIDREENLRPLHWRNNASKGADYPSYIASVKAENDRNRLIETTFDVNAVKQAELKALYNL